MDKREETSNWLNEIKDQDDEYERTEDLVNTRIAVRILPNTFSPTEIICQRLALLSKYEDLQKEMNEYYQIKSNVSSASSRKSSTNSIADSLNDETSNDTCDILKQPFKVGDYCAALINKTWVRCKILDLSNPNKFAYIECIDDGRTQRLHLSKLETLSGPFTLLPHFALKCKLAQLNDSFKLISLDVKAIDKFKKFICEKEREFVADIIKFQKNENDNNIFEIELFYENTNIIQMLTKSN